jgi:hypothetical protein
MSQAPPPPGPSRADQVVEVKHDPARDTDFPPPQSAEQTDANKQAHMVAAGLAAVTAAQILKREEEAAAAPLAVTTRQSASSSSVRTGASLPAIILAWVFLLAVGLGSIAGMIAIIIVMLR